MKQIISCRLPTELVADLNEIAEEQGFSRSQLIRQMLSAYVEYLRIDDVQAGSNKSNLLETWSCTPAIPEFTICLLRARK